MAVKPLGNTFLFAFLNETVNGMFEQKNAGRIIIAAPTQNRFQDDQGTRARWARVLAVGPRVSNFKNGSIVLIKPGRWTTGFEHDGVKVWKSDEEQVVALGSDESVAFDHKY